MSEFTLGPWQIIHVTDREIGKDLGMDIIAPYLIAGSDSVQIARIDDEFTNRLTPAISALANAHLIAAAPDLLEALVAVKEFDARMNAKNTPMIGNGIMSKVNTAINKALNK